ncbi:MAG: hypothetical protein IRZ09_06065 [Variibacter sp.]|nr:hypothetical protein [Variibacter sp.]
MTVVLFPPRAQSAHRGWRPDELQQLIALFAAQARRSGTTIFWEIGTTESGDPQFYLLGPAPDYECLLCCSRLDALYVLEDGAGGVLTEDRSLRQILREAARAVFAPRRGAVAARLLVLLATLRITIEQKLEPFLAESSEWIGRFAPQLAALA